MFPRLILMLLALAPSLASSEMYKCQRPDGMVVFANVACGSKDILISIDGVSASEIKRVENEKRRKATEQEQARAIAEEMQQKAAREERIKTERVAPPISGARPSGGISDGGRSSTRTVELQRKRDAWFSWDNSTKMRTIEGMMESTKRGGYSPRFGAAHYAVEIDRMLASGAGITVPEAFALLMTAEEMRRR